MTKKKVPAQAPEAPSPAIANAKASAAAANAKVVDLKAKASAAAAADPAPQPAQEQPHFVEVYMVPREKFDQFVSWVHKNLTGEQGEIIRSLIGGGSFGHASVRHK